MNDLDPIEQQSSFMAKLLQVRMDIYCNRLNPSLFENSALQL